MRIENPRLRAAIFYTFLRPMIVVNYWLRRRKLLRDEWFWADALALSWGYVVDDPGAT